MIIFLLLFRVGKAHPHVGVEAHYGHEEEKRINLEHANAAERSWGEAIPEPVPAHEPESRPEKKHRKKKEPKSTFAIPTEFPTKIPEPPMPKFPTNPLNPLDAIGINTRMKQGSELDWRTVKKYEHEPHPEEVLDKLFMSGTMIHTKKRAEKVIDGPNM